MGRQSTGRVAARGRGTGGQIDYICPSINLIPVVYNFNAGPSILPKEVFEEASRAILDFNGTGLSILEIGHRTSLFQQVVDEAMATARELMRLDAEHEILFLHGGASTQFFQVPMNLLNEGATAAYLDGGVWGKKAIKEARIFGNVEVVASSRDRNYTYIPKGYAIPADAAYFHFTTNNTIEGTQMHDFPEISVPLVADMSSDILSRVLDFNRFDLIYAGAQKNIGAAGVNLVVVRKDILGKVNRPLPTMIDYREHIAAGSLLNTPPVFAIYVCMLTLRWLKQQGGIPAIEEINNRKAALLYETLDSLPLFRPTVAKEDRSKMNVVFVMDDPALEKAFLTACKANGMVGVKGHRSVGGFRVSLYNAMPLQSVEVLTELMNDFAHTKA
jgi:phosphoserine aminotransferase